MSNFSKGHFVFIFLFISVFTMNAQLLIKTSQVKANNYDFTFLEAGTGPLVIFLHGFPDNPYSFQSQILALAQTGYHCIAPFKRGFTPGDTTVAPIQHFTTYTQDIIALIEAFKEKQVILIGHDWGAGAAYGVAQYAPEKVKAIVTMAIPLSPVFFSANVTNPQQVKRSWYLFFFQSPYAIDALKYNDYNLIEMLWKDWCPDWKGYTEHLTSVKQTFRKPGSAESAVEYYRQSFGNYNVTDPVLQKIQNVFMSGKPFIVPTLYLHGQNDGCVGIENVEGMEQLFANKFEKHIIPDAGHFIQMEKPETVSNYILEFIKNLK